MEMQRFIGHQPAVLIHLQRNGGDLQQGVGFGVKSCGFNIDHHRIKTAETVAQTIQLSVLGHQILLAGKSSAHYGKFCRGLQQAGVKTTGAVAPGRAHGIKYASVGKR